MTRRCCGLAVALLVCCPAVLAAQEEVFSDDFEWGSICAWDNDRWYLDLDDDLFGDWSDPGVTSDCPPPVNTVANDLDCDDGEWAVNPGADEVCNGGDDDCDTETDEGDLCTIGLDCCDGDCRDLDFDEAHCGFCDNACSQDDMCCDGDCTAVETDPLHCGFCGNACDLDNTAVNECINEHCAVGTCDEGWDNCNSFHDDGCETAIGSDPSNCGECDFVCDLPNTASHFCFQGGCRVASCAHGFKNCNPSHEDGCETPVLNDLNNCGECDNLCDMPHTEVAACVSGACRVVECEALWDHCDSSHLNGCEEYVGSSVLNCGACDHICPGHGAYHTTAWCTDGECFFNCYGDRYDCNGNPLDLCEADDPLSSADHHTGNTAEYLGSFSCSDNESDPDISDLLFSDRHDHTSVDGFDSSTGSAPDWFYLNATGGYCVNNVELQLSVSGSSCGDCYRLWVDTDVDTYTCDTNGSGTCTVSEGSGSYSDNTEMDIRVEKTCTDAACIEEVSYTVTGHL